MSEAAESGLRPPPHWLFRSAARDFRYLFYCRAFALASAARLTLPDALSDDFRIPAALHWFAAFILAINGAVLGWLLAAVGTTLPLLLLEDQLSQSLYLCFCAWTAVLCFVGRADGREQRLLEQLPRGVRAFTLAVYLFAAIHKCNSGYLDPRFGCANEGLRVLFEQARFSLPAALVPWLDSRAWPIAHLLVEATIPLLLFWRPVAGVLLAAAMHAPLTVIFAPSFAFTMMSGWVCFFTGDELRRVTQCVRRHALPVVAAGASLAVLSRALFFAGRSVSDPEWVFKEALFWLLSAAVALGLPRALRLGARGDTGLLPVSARVGAFVVAYGLNAMTPYLGLQFHHTAAMLSNLRIDAGCWNSWLVPESIRIRDPYVRLERIAFAAGRATPDAARAFSERLWEPSALYEARARWCRTHPEPLLVAGSYDGVEFEREDFCAEGGWPLREPVLPGLRLFQVNITRTCQKRCLH